MDLNGIRHFPEPLPVEDDVLFWIQNRPNMIQIGEFELLLPILGSVKKSLRGYIGRLAESQFMANWPIVTSVHLQYIYCQLAWKLWAFTKLPRTGYRISRDFTFNMEAWESNCSLLHKDQSLDLFH